METEKITSKYDEKRNLRNLYSQRRCENKNCRKIVPYDPPRRTTCCVNRQRVFCSERCKREWVREWMQRQENPKYKQRSYGLI